MANRLEGLQAEADMRLATAVAVGVAGMTPESRRDALSAWRGAARRSRGRGAILTRDQRVALAQASGIRVVTE